MSVERPPAPPIDTPSPATVEHASSQSPTLWAGHTTLQSCCGCHTSAPCRGSQKAQLGRDHGRAWQSKWLQLCGLGPPIDRKVVLSSFSQLVPVAKDGVHAGSWPHRGPGSPGHLPGGCPEEAGWGCRGQAAPCRGHPATPWAPRVLLPPSPMGLSPFLGPQETEAEMNIY